MTRDRRYTVFSLLGSTLLHGSTALAIWGALAVWAWRHPVAWQVPSGRAAVELAASMPARASTKQPPADEPIEMAVSGEPMFDPPLEPLAAHIRAEQLQRQPPQSLHVSGKLRLPPSEAEAPRDAAPRVQPVSAMRCVPRQQPPMPEVVLAASPARTVRPPTIDAVADSTASAASAPSQASAGAEANAPASAVFNPAPEYPPTALAARQSGRVVVRATIGIDGQPKGIEVHQSSGIAALDQAAVKAVGRWRFEPARRGGKPAEVDVTIPIRFKLAPP